MELNPHDLLEIHSINNLIDYNILPEWAEASIALTPFVVVRRARPGPGFAAVGIRGFQRSQRFAAILPIDCIKRKVTPEDLVKEQKWKKQDKDIFRNLEAIAQIMNHYSLEWGIAGSVGFELATGKETTTPSSDIDLVIRYNDQFTSKLAKKIKKELEKIKVRVDIQVETRYGAFSFFEYASCEDRPILLRTIDGPMLKKI
ncbi:malonate decarboxylase holo-ACP synthase [Bacillus norwichensis]|uniref:Malonate decarboxylase holo-ACP synthase n=1 Tax=Bacillus norwichensis TaxID=2762217 RepID=A0ABR8VKB8_9BACI|nr:malonate decarboxylase holo-ACP synthase [Bacillus norwichensis]MBD8005163.1 malonate decarboxylase holo-ACP synthase [Bacillus norwichensis]